MIQRTMIFSLTHGLGNVVVRVDRIAFMRTTYGAGNESNTDICFSGLPGDFISVECEIFRMDRLLFGDDIDGDAG